MGQPSSEASYALIYLTYGAFLSVQPMNQKNPHLQWGTAT